MEESKKVKIFFFGERISRLTYLYDLFVDLHFYFSTLNIFAFLGSLMIGVTKYTGESRSSGNITGEIPSKKGARVNLLS